MLCIGGKMQFERMFHGHRLSLYPLDSRGHMTHAISASRNSALRFTWIHVTSHSNCSNPHTTINARHPAFHAN